MREQLSDLELYQIIRNVTTENHKILLCANYLDSRCEYFFIRSYASLFNTEVYWFSFDIYFSTGGHDKNSCMVHCAVHKDYGFHNQSGTNDLQKR